MSNGSSNRIDRIEQLLEQIVQIQQRAISLQGQQQEQIQVLVNAAADHAARLARQDALIERLDAIIERMVYREGRGNGDQPQP